jgi:hypothetical protein
MLDEWEEKFTQVVCVNLQVFVEIVDDIVIRIRLNHLNNVHDDSTKELKSFCYIEFFHQTYMRII